MSTTSDDDKAAGQAWDPQQFLNQPVYGATWVPPKPEVGFQLLRMAGEMVAHAAPPTWLIEGVKEVNTIGIEFGKWGAGKSFRALDEAIRIAAGMAIHGHAVRQGLVIYILGEGHGGFYRRLAAWQQAFQVLLTDVPLAITRCAIPMVARSKDTTTSRPNCVEHLHAEIVRMASDYGSSPVAIYLDSLARNFGEGDESSPTDMGRFVDAIDQWLREPFGACVTALHHPGHAAQQRGRGGSSLPAAADFEFRIRRHDPDIIGMICTKARDSTIPRPLYWRLTGVPLILQGQPCDGAVVTELADYAPRSTKSPSPQALQVLELLKTLDSQKRTELHAAGENSDTAAITATQWRKAAVAADIVTRQSFYNVKKKLVQDGLVAIGDDDVVQVVVTGHGDT